MTSSLPRTEAAITAVVKQGPGAGGVRLATVPGPATPPGFARVEVLATGVCGTDVHIADDEYTSEPPVVMGHEVLGRVVEVADSGHQDWVGRIVAMETYFSTCGRCDWCRSGRINLCPQRRSIGSFEDGGFAEVLVLPVTNLHAVPSNITGLEGVLSEPLACVAQCLLDPPVVSAGDRVLVTGPGTIGQLAAQVARAGGGQVVLAGLAADAARLDVAASVGLDTAQVDRSEAPRGHYDVVIECSGAAAGAATGLESVRRGGRYVQVGIFGHMVSVPLDAVLYKELVVTSGFASTPASWRRAMALLGEGDLDLAPLLGQRIGLGDFDRALATVRSAAGLKTVVVPS